MLTGRPRTYGAVVKVQAEGVVAAGLATAAPGLVAEGLVAATPPAPKHVLFHLASYPKETQQPHIFPDSHAELSRIMSEFANHFKNFHRPSLQAGSLAHLQFEQFGRCIIQFLIH